MIFVSLCAQYVHNELICTSYIPFFKTYFTFSVVHSDKGAIERDGISTGAPSPVPTRPGCGPPCLWRPVRPLQRTSQPPPQRRAQRAPRCHGRCWRHLHQSSPTRTVIERGAVAGMSPRTAFSVPLGPSIVRQWGDGV
jgi:hypothetical protein